MKNNIKIKFMSGQNDFVKLRVWEDGNYVSIDAKGRLVHLPGDSGAVFKIIVHQWERRTSPVIQLEYNGKYVSVDPGKLDDMNLPVYSLELSEIQDHSYFFIIWRGLKRVALRSVANEMFVSKETLGGNILMANRDIIDIEETITFEEVN